MRDKPEDWQHYRSDPYRGSRDEEPQPSQERFTLDPTIHEKLDEILKKVGYKVHLFCPCCGRDLNGVEHPGYKFTVGVNHVHCQHCDDYFIVDIKKTE